MAVNGKDDGYEDNYDEDCPRLGCEEVQTILNAYNHIRGNEDEVDCWDDLYIGNDPKLKLSLLQVSGGLSFLRGMYCRAFSIMFNRRMSELIKKDGKDPLTLSDSRYGKYDALHGDHLHKEIRVQLQNQIKRFPGCPSPKWVDSMIMLHGSAGILLIALRDSLWECCRDNVRKEDRKALWTALRVYVVNHLAYEDFLID